MILSKPKITYVYYSTGEVYTESHIVNKIRHRDNAPAVIYYRQDGSIKREYYYQHGKLHRNDGPALTYYYSDGTIEYIKYFKHDKQLDNNAFAGLIPGTQEFTFTFEML